MIVIQYVMQFWKKGGTDAMQVKKTKEPDRNASCAKSDGACGHATREIQFVPLLLLCAICYQL